MDKSFLWIGAKGQAGGDQNNLTWITPFFIASIDKMFNATLAMKLVESGDLNLDDTISTYLSLTLCRGLHKLQGVDYSENITLRHLLTHTSGLADWLEDSPKNGSSLVDQLIEEGDREISLEEIAALVRNKLSPHFPPQDLNSKNPKARYSDTNYMLLIAIIEQVTGEPLANVYEQMFIEPMDLGHTNFPGHVPPSESTPEPMPPVIGHTGSTGCWLFYCPLRELLLAGSVNEVTAPAVPFRIVPKMLDLLRK